MEFLRIFQDSQWKNVPVLSRVGDFVTYLDPQDGAKTTNATQLPLAPGADSPFVSVSDAVADETQPLFNDLSS